MRESSVGIYLTVLYMITIYEFVDPIQYSPLHPRIKRRLQRIHKTKQMEIDN